MAEHISPAQPQHLPTLAELKRQEADLKSQLRELSTQSGPQPGWWSVDEAMTISSAVLIFGLVTICITAWLLRRERESYLILRTLGTILILTFAVFLIVAGYSDQQIAPAMGLLGTIAGYLLGKEMASTGETRDPEVRKEM